MTSTPLAPGHSCSHALNRFFYCTGLLLALYFLVVYRDYSAAASNMGIALIFDPYNQKVRWQNRSLVKRIGLIVHLVVLFALLGVMLFTHFLG